MRAVASGLDFHVPLGAIRDIPDHTDPTNDPKHDPTVPHLLIRQTTQQETRLMTRHFFLPQKNTFKKNNHFFFKNSG